MWLTACRAGYFSLLDHSRITIIEDPAIESRSRVDGDIILSMWKVYVHISIEYTYITVNNTYKL